MSSLNNNGAVVDAEEKEKKRLYILRIEFPLWTMGNFVPSEQMLYLRGGEYTYNTQGSTAMPEHIASRKWEGTGRLAIPLCEHGDARDESVPGTFANVEPR